MTHLAEIGDLAMALPPDDRLALVTMLWDSLAEGERAHDTDVIALARQRTQELDSGQVIGVSHEEVMASFEKVLNEAHLSSRG